MFIALIIVCLAALIIFNRVNAIMDYPAQLSANASGNVEEPVGEGYVDPAPPANEGDNPTTEPPVQTPANNSNGNTTVVNHSIYIEPGSTGSQIADLLLSVKLINTKDEFINAVDSSGASSKLKAGTFVIPSNSTLAQTIAILTK